MYFFLIKLLLVAVGAAAAPPASTSACNEDNCLRAVQASAFTTRQGTVDCMSYFLTTVTPATSTSTVTVTATATTTDLFTVTNIVTLTSVISDVIVVPETATVTVDARRKRNSIPLARPAVDLVARQMTVAPSSIPAYASACSGSVRYSSACSCIGVTKSTTTAPTPITTKTVTVTTVQTSDITLSSSATLVVDVTTTVLDTTTVATATTTVCAVGPSETFVLSAVGGTYNGQYAYLAPIPDSDGDGDMGILFGSLSTASTFNVDAAGHLSSGNHYANSDAGIPEDFVFFDTAAVISTSGFPYTTCAILPGGALQCSNGIETIFQTCSGLYGVSFPGLVLADTIESGCTALALLTTCV